MEAVVITHQQLRIDTSIAKEDSAFSTPSSIVIVPIFPPVGDFDISSEEWFKGLYYYMIANDQRPGFTDLPFHYVVSSDGNVYKGNTAGEERRITIEGAGNNLAVIGYLANRGETSFDPRATAALGQTILDIANSNAINVESKVSAVAINYQQDDASQQVKLVKQDLFGLWSNSLDKLIKDIKPFYKPVDKEYKVRVAAVTFPTTPVTPGQIVNGSISLENTGEHGIYGDTISALLGSKTSGDSIFYSGANWASLSQFALMKDTDLLLPKQTRDFSFAMKVPLYFGEQTEEFTLKTMSGYEIPNTKFHLKLTVEKGNLTVVEVKATASNVVRAYKSPSQSSGEIYRISKGERFVQLETTTNGWAKLDFGDKGQGWVARQYLTVL